ncbi:MAG: response regulator [Bryobacteraceae bacterium]
MSKLISATPAEILLVENNPGDVRLLQEAFKEADLICKLNVARDGEQALAFLYHQDPYANSRRPDLILLDLNLPRKDGREVLAEIKREKSLKRIPVVILSTSTRQEDIQKAYDLHANCYIPKPEDLESLVKLSHAIETFWFRSAIQAG